MHILYIDVLFLFCCFHSLDLTWLFQSNPPTPSSPNFCWAPTFPRCQEEDSKEKEP